MGWTCPICGEPGKRTREHVFARWLSDLFGVASHPITLYSSRGGKLWSARGLDTVVSVCATCNSGWMSELEVAFRAVYKDAILGYPRTLNGADLTTLAHWATKTALMLQPHLSGMGEVVHVPTGHRRALPRGTPPGTRVWLGAYAPRTRYVFWQHAPMALARQPAGDSTWAGYVTLMTVGNLMIAVLGMDREHGDAFTVEGFSEDAFVSVWPNPPDTLQWPHALVLNDRDIAAFWPPRTGELVVRGA